MQQTGKNISLWGKLEQTAKNIRVWRVHRGLLSPFGLIFQKKAL